MNTPTIANAADYAEALLTARRARNLVAWPLAVMVLAQLVLFCTLHFSSALDRPLGLSAAATQPTSHPASSGPLAALLHYAVAFTQFAGLALGVVLCGILLLMLNVTLLARTLGVGALVRAIVWCLILLVLLFPWQAFLNNQDLSAAEFKIPGVLYHWEELRQYAKFNPPDWPTRILKWARFTAFPLLALGILVNIQVKSGRALKQALGGTNQTTPT